MHIRVIAVGERQPAWVDEAVETYARRLPRQWRFRIDTIPAAPRRKSEPPETAIRAEAEKILERIGNGDRFLLLDERGRQVSSPDIANGIGEWQASGRDVVFVIGGPDGVGETLRSRAENVLSLSRLTLPHGLARVLLLEQLYRGWTLLSGHPYHRN